MKKLTYLKVFNRESNQRIWSGLLTKYQAIKQKSILLAYFFIPVMCIACGFMAILGWFASLALFFMDTQFTPHYMKTTITYEKMTIEHAVKYLNSQEYRYKKSVSYGNMSNKKRKSIETTFALLYDEYKLPESKDNKHLAVISGLSKIENLSLEHNQHILNLNSDIKEVSVELSSQITNQYTITGEQLTNIEQSVADGNSATKESVSVLSKQISESVNVLFDQNNVVKDEIITIRQSVDNSLNGIINATVQIRELSSQQTNSFSETQKRIDNINHNVELVKSAIEPIASYTEQKQQKEEAEKEHFKELRDNQEKRKSTAHNREKGKKLASFESALSDKQIAILVKYCNKIAVFDRDVEFLEIKDILLCIHQKPLKLAVNRYLSSLFTKLYNNGLICKTWKSVASRHKCFVSAKNKALTPNDFYMANSTSVFMDDRISDLIDECIEKISVSSNR